jgi:hypothetical protein
MKKSSFNPDLIIIGTIFPGVFSTGPERRFDQKRRNKKRAAR